MYIQKNDTLKPLILRTIELNNIYVSQSFRFDIFAFIFWA